MCVSVCFSVFYSLCFVKSFVLTAFPWPAIMVILISLVSYIHANATCQCWISLTTDSAIGRQRGNGIQKGIIKELAASRAVLMSSLSSSSSLNYLLFAINLCYFLVAMFSLSVYFRLCVHDVSVLSLCVPESGPSSCRPHYHSRARKGH